MNTYLRQWTCRASTTRVKVEQLWYLGSSENSAHNPFLREWILDGTSHKRVIQRLVVACAAIATVELRHFGFALLKTLAIILPIFGVAMIFLIAVDPRSQTRGICLAQKNRLR